MEDTNGTYWKVVAKASGLTQANIIAGRLASEGIATRLRYEAAGSIYAITIDGLGEVRVLVPPDDWERARDVLSRAYEDGEIHWEQAQADTPDQTGGPSD